MEPLNNDMNDIDALFRKAARGYPLKAGDGDWESILGKIATKPVTISPVKKNTRGKYLWSLAMLFLISAGSMLYYDITDKSHTQSRNILNTASSSAENPTSTLQPENNIQSSRVNTNKIIREKSDIGSPGNGRMPFENHLEENVLDKVAESSDQVVARSFEFSRMPMFPDRSILMFNRPGGAHLKFEDAVNMVEKSIISKDKSVLLNQNKKQFYLVITAGLDLSNVKFQASNKTGYNLGLLAGYRFNRKIWIESGVLCTRKKYYSDGRYFTMSKLETSKPSNMKIMAVDGEFTFLEIPLKLKYDFAYTKRSNLFISSGISANMCLKERNNYLTDMNGSQAYQVGVYKDVSVCPISLVNISAGYEHKLDNSRAIRIEPYIKIPLTKVGMGSLPVFSTGINVAVSSLLSKGKK